MACLNFQIESWTGSFHCQYLNILFSNGVSLKPNSVSEILVCYYKFNQKKIYLICPQILEAIQDNSPVHDNRELSRRQVGPIR